MNDVEGQACYVCKGSQSSDTITCAGVCNQFVHAKCIKMTKTMLKIFEDSDDLFYMCDDCNRDSCKATNAKLNKMCIYDERLTRSEFFFTNLVEQMGEIKALISERNGDGVISVPESNTNKSKTYAEKVKMCNNETVVLLKPKNNQNCEATENDIKLFVDPTKLNINNLRKVPNGGIAIECSERNALYQCQN